MLKTLRRNKHTPLEKKTDLYKLSCDDCNCFYIGQTGRGFLKCFLEPVSYTHLDVYKRQH